MIGLGKGGFEFEYLAVPFKGTVRIAVEVAEPCMVGQHGGCERVTLGRIVGRPGVVLRLDASGVAVQRHLSHHALRGGADAAGPQA